MLPPGSVVKLPFPQDFIALERSRQTTDNGRRKVKQDKAAGVFASHNRQQRRTLFFAGQRAN